MPEPRQITDLAEKATALFLSEQAKQFGECAVNLMATSMPIAEVLEWLERQADMLREFG
jgi:hypothetical protein